MGRVSFGLPYFPSSWNLLVILTPLNHSICRFYAGGMQRGIIIIALRHPHSMLHISPFPFLSCFPSQYIGVNVPARSPHLVEKPLTPLQRLLTPLKPWSVSPKKQWESTTSEFHPISTKPSGHAGSSHLRNASE